MRKRLALLAAITLGLTACSPASGILTGGGYTIAVSEPTDGSMEAIVAGTIIADENGCLRLDGADGTPLILWVSGTTIDDDGVVTSNGREYRVGDEITGGGGYIPLQEPYEECEGVDVVVLDPGD